MRCEEWTDLTTILEGAGAVYGKIPCAQRDSVNAVVWWLADPLYAEPGNERRVEHYVRQLLIALHSSVQLDPCNPPGAVRCSAFDGRFDWNDLHGGAAIREMILRFGWPAFGIGMESRNMGDDHLNGYLQDSGPRVLSTNEYTPSRLHTLPHWSDVEHPLQLNAGDWDLGRPGRELWWPVEHYARDAGPIGELRSGYQLAMFRRDDDIHVAMATEIVPQEIGSVPGGSLRVALALGATPQSMRVISVNGAAGLPVVAQMASAAGQQLLGLEAIRPSPEAGRTDGLTHALWRRGASPLE